MSSFPQTWSMVLPPYLVAHSFVSGFCWLRYHPRTLVALCWSLFLTDHLLYHVFISSHMEHGPSSSHTGQLGTCGASSGRQVGAHGAPRHVRCSLMAPCRHTLSTWSPALHPQVAVVAHTGSCSAAVQPLSATQALTGHLVTHGAPSERHASADGAPSHLWCTLTGAPGPLRCTLWVP